MKKVSIKGYILKKNAVKYVEIDEDKLRNELSEVWLHFDDSGLNAANLWLAYKTGNISKARFIKYIIDKVSKANPIKLKTEKGR